MDQRPGVSDDEGRSETRFQLVVMALALIGFGILFVAEFRFALHG